MSETLSTHEVPSEEKIDLEALHDKEQSILAGEADISVLSDKELRTLEAEVYPDREEDIDRAHDIALATDTQETGMAHSRDRIAQVDREISELESSKDDASWHEKLKINKQVGNLENDIRDIDNVDYWNDIKEQRDRKAAEAAAQHDARAEVEAALNQEK